MSGYKAHNETAYARAMRQRRQQRDRLYARLVADGEGPATAAQIADMTVYEDEYVEHLAHRSTTP